MTSYPSQLHFSQQGMKSNIEFRLADFIASLGLKVSFTQKLDRQHIDIYLPQKKIGIEVNGIRFHSTAYNAPLVGAKFKSKDYHQLKTIEALKQGILLYHFWDFEPLAKMKKEVKLLLEGQTLSEVNVDKNPMLVGLGHLEPRYYIAKDVSIYHKGSIFPQKPMCWSTSKYSVYEFYNSGYICKSANTQI